MQAPEKVVDPLTQQLGPILLALAASEKTANSHDTLQAALPHCLVVGKEERHSFQNRIIDLTASALSGLGDAARAQLAEAEGAAGNLRAQLAVTQSDFETEQRVADGKKEESDAKAIVVEEFGGQVEAAKQGVKAEIEKKDEFLASKATLSSDQEAFQKVLEDLWQPLKASSFVAQAWRKRDKCCTELVEKTKVLALEESLVEALKATLKMKVDQRSTFAAKALSCVEDAFNKHQALLADRVAGAAGEEAAREAAVAEAEAKLTAVQAQLAEHDKEYEGLQNVWAELESKAGVAKKSAADFGNELEDAVEEVNERKSEVDAALANSASFATLCEGPAPQPVATIEEVAEEQPACPMETEAEAVAVAA